MLDTIFDKIYVVWGTDPERKKYIQDHFNDRNIENYKFVKSITPEDLLYNDSVRFKFLWNKNAIKPPDAFKTQIGSPYPLSLGEVCCSYGHLKAYKTALKDGCENFLVIEDDAILNKDMVDNSLDWKHFIPNDWDILHLHSWRPFNSKREPVYSSRRKKVNDYFYSGYREYGGTVCYALTRTSAKMLLSFSYPICLPSDGIISQLSASFYSRKFNKSYVIEPFLCDTTMFESQIDLEIKPKGYMTRKERYNNKEIKKVFDPNVL